MSQNQIDILQRALLREKAARKQAEKILEEKSLELYNSNKNLERLNVDLETLLTKTDSQLQGVFENIIDAYVIMDLQGNILKMNNAALHLLGFKNDKVDYNLINMVDPKDYNKVSESFNSLLNKGSITDFEIDITTNKKQKKIVHINGSIIYDQKKPVAAQGIIRDITASRKEELIIHVINDAAKGVIGKLDIFEIATVLSNQIANFLETDDCVIYLYDESNHTLEQIGAYGQKLDEEKQIINKLTFRSDTGITGHVARTGIGEIVHNTELDSRYLKDLSFNKSEITVPIKIGDKVIGIIDSENEKEDFYTQKQLDTLNNIAAIVALQLQSAIELRERKIVERQLAHSEKRLSVLISSLDTGILFEDENRNIAIINNKFCELFNIPVTPDQLIGKNIIEQTLKFKAFANLPSQYFEYIDKIWKIGEPELGYEFKTTNGLVLERDYIPIKDKNNNSFGHLWSYRDATLRHNYEQSLEALANKYDNIITNMNLGLLEVDLNEKIILANQSFLNMSGYEKEELIGKIASEIFTTGKNKELVLSENAKRLKKQSNSYEIEVVHKSGEKKYWLVSGGPNTNIQGETIGSIGIHLDITELKKLELQRQELLSDLEKRNEELKEYAHVVSHDLKSPLRSIHALVSWIKEDNENALEKASIDNLNLVQITVEKMERLITDILNYSSMSQNIVEPQSTDINMLCDEIKSLFVIPDNITIKRNKILPTITGDKIKLHQLFQNLLSNAIRYNDKEEGIIEIDFEDKGTQYLFSIKDNGIGIEEKYFDKIFEIFHSLNKIKGSTGIGLSIVKKVVEIHGGEIWLESEIGKGTTFYFTLNKNLYGAT